MVGFFDFFTNREKTVKHKTIKTEISKLCEKLMDGIIDLSEIANKMKDLKEQLKNIPEDESESGSDSDNTDKNSPPSIAQKDDINSGTTAPPVSSNSSSASPTPNNDDKGFLANFNIFGSKKAEPAAEPDKPNPEPATEPEKQNPEPPAEPEKKQEVSNVSSESPLPRPDAVMPNKDLAVAAAATPVNPNNYTDYLATGGPNPEYEKNIRGGKDKKRRKKTKHANPSSSGKRTKKQKHNTVSNEAQAQAQAQAQA